MGFYQRRICSDRILPDRDNTIYGGLLKRPAALPPEGTGTNAFVCSVQVENFDLVSESILHHDGVVAMPKFAVPGRCWQGYFLDPDHNVFGIFQVDEQAGRS
jgi:uncharacterized protein